MVKFFTLPANHIITRSTNQRIVMSDFFYLARTNFGYKSGFSWHWLFLTLRLFKMLFFRNLEKVPLLPLSNLRLFQSIFIIPFFRSIFMNLSRNFIRRIVIAWAVIQSAIFTHSHFTWHAHHLPLPSCWYVVFI